MIRRSVARAGIGAAACVAMLGIDAAIAHGDETLPSTTAPPVVREIESSVDHNHCTTRQFQHKTFLHEGVWFVFYSDGSDFMYQTSYDDGDTWERGAETIAPAPNGSTSFDVLKVGVEVFVSHAHYPLGRYDVNAPYAKDPAQRGTYTHEGRVKRGEIDGREIHWTHDVNPGFTPDYSNIVQSSDGHFWVFTRSTGQGVAHQSVRPRDIAEWAEPTVCIPEEGRHALDVAALAGGKLYAASVLTEEGKLYGSLYDGASWQAASTLISDAMTTVAGDDRRLSLEFDPTNGHLHLLYVDGEGVLRYRSLDAPYAGTDWTPGLAEDGAALATGVFTSALSVDTSLEPYGLVATYGVERHVGADKRERTGEIHARGLVDGAWVGDAFAVTPPGTIHNWYPNVNQDVSGGLCVMYSRSVDEQKLGAPLAVMVSVLGRTGD